MTGTLIQDRTSLINSLGLLDTRLRWLPSWTIHNTNHIRPKRDGLKVGGYQAIDGTVAAQFMAAFRTLVEPPLQIVR